MAKKRDEGHEETEEVLKELERRITKEYEQAEKEIAEKLDDYMRRFEIKDKLKRQAVLNGQITQEEYEQWRYGQVMIGERWTEMRDTIAEELTNTAQIAKEVANGYMPEVYAINHNYGTFQVEKVAKVNTSYTLYNKEAVERLFDDEQILYHKAGYKTMARINAGKQMAWDKKIVQSVMTQALLQGESIGKIATRLSKAVGETDRKASIRNARTMTTGVQNAGRIDAYKRAEKMGIEMEQEWLATLDGRTRHEHRILDGQRVKVGDKFKVAGYELAYPADPAGPAFLVYNCRCTVIPALKGFAPEASDLSLRNTSKMEEATYEEWKNAHASHSDPITKQDEIAERMKKAYGAEYKGYAKGLNNSDNESDIGDKFFSLFKTTEEQVENFKAGLSGVYNKSISSELERADERVRYKRHLSKTRYKSTNRTVYLSPDATASSVAHELFHNIDHTHRITEKGAITASVTQDFYKLQKRGDIRKYLMKKYPDAFEGNNLKVEYRGISDIIHGCTNGEVFLGYGHKDKDYWKKEKRLERETFAQSGRMYYDNNEEVLKMFKAEFPKVSEEFLKIMEGL